MFLLKKKVAVAYFPRGVAGFFDILNTLLPPPPLASKPWCHRAWMNQHNGRAKKKLSKELNNNITWQIWDMSLAGVCVFVSPPPLMVEHLRHVECHPTADNRSGKGTKKMPPNCDPKYTRKLQKEILLKKIPIGFCWILGVKKSWDLIQGHRNVVEMLPWLPGTKPRG